MSRKEPRLYFPHDLKQGVSLALSHDQTHYLMNVMRLGSGDHVRLFCDEHGEWRAKLDVQGKKKAGVVVLDHLRAPQTRPFLGLAFTPLRPHRLSFLVEKAVELGVSDLFPVLTKYTAVRHVNEDKLRAAAIEAAEQCERLDVPTLHPLQDLGQFCGNLTPSQHLYFCHERQEGGLLWDHAGSPPKFPLILVGPEGGFDAQEVTFLKGLPGVTSVSLGQGILRAETAALAALSLFHGAPRA
ncbi:MAG: 16S rRNA (uracil(1498)-N(3))-methyltransferase [Alphaproteobacteria bacterium]|nr:16S rRNA (uracil(1498)-N(3))-methyltransferase [Alphaproteobacteria bacterium]